MVLGSQPRCFGSFKDVYTRAWRFEPDYRAELVLERRELAYDDYPPILGRVLPDDVLIEFTADGFLSGDVHVAVRHYTLQGGTARRIDPIAGLPRDFVLEWLDAPWEESRSRSESAALQTLHDELRRPDKVGDIAEPTRRCTAGPDVWQVGTSLFEGPKRSCPGPVAQSLRLFDGWRQRDALSGLYRAGQPRPDVSGPAREPRALRCSAL